MNKESIDSGLVFNNSYAQQLPDFCVQSEGDKAPEPTLIKLNVELSKTLGLSTESLSDVQIASILSGSVTPTGAQPVAQVYAGHQFGHFSPQLGDGRALLVGEVMSNDNQRLDIHLKGSGRTVFSRSGDGKAALGPVLREYLLAEAMHHLNIPTTRALSVVTTGEEVMRNAPLTGAVLGRVASSHIRVGTFQFFAARGENEKVKQLADYTIERHFSHLSGNKDCYLELVNEVCKKQAVLIAKWMNVGFIHGVMNTDNMTICGETIDYGPCAFLDDYHPTTVFSSIDAQGRYAYENQPIMAKWNLARLAETLLFLIDEDDKQAIMRATKIIDQFDEYYRSAWLKGMRDKLGLFEEQPEDFDLATDLLSILAAQEVDYTQFFTTLTQCLNDKVAIADSFVNLNDGQFINWQQRWLERLEKETNSNELRVSLMSGVNPIYIARNHKVEEALKAAQDDNNFEPFEVLLKLLCNPYERQADAEEYELGAAKSLGLYRTFCGT